MPLLHRIAAALAVAAPLTSAPLPTAVYTLDHLHGDISVSPADEIDARLESWARGCRIVPGKPFVQLDCAPAPEPDPEAEALPATLALFRDLDEQIYLVGCPLFDRERIRRLERETRKEEDERTPDPELEADLRDCADVEAGRTFSVEVEDDEMRAVIRGRQLRLNVYRLQPKEQTTSTPYEAQPTRGALGHAGPPTTSAPAALNPVQEPNWAPPSEPRSLVRPKLAERSLRDPGVAATSLRSARLRVACSAAAAEIWIDGAFLGAAPIYTPLPAGLHVVTAKGREREWTAEIELEAGDGKTIDPCRR